VARGRRVGWGLLGVAAIFVTLQFAWILRNRDQLAPVTTERPAPSFALPEIGQGGSLLAAVEVAPGGRVKVLEFWATWCAICIRGLPHLEALRKAHPEVDIITINLDDATKARRLFDDQAYGLRLLFDNRGIADRYGVSSLPHLVVIGRDGKVREVKRGGPGDLEALLK
jgi:thiol-disulfide isomerase/thioredoxin